MTQPPAEPGAAVACPFCGSVETEWFAMFGHFLLASQYYCRGCRTVFDVLRWDDAVGAASSETGKTPPSGRPTPDRGASQDGTG